MKLLHGNEIVGEITTNRSLSIDECIELLEIDIEEYEYELFRMEY